MFRFTIRDVLWLTALVAVTLGLGLGWWNDRAGREIRLAEQQRLVDMLISDEQETMRAIGESGYAVVERFGQVKLEKQSRGASNR